MRERPSGTWFLIKKYPEIVRGGLRLVMDEPSAPKLRVDPDGERKLEARRRKNAEWEERKRSAGYAEDFPADMVRKPPPLKTIHLQWLDTSYDPVWRDADIRIDLATRRIHDAGGFLGGGRRGSGAIGVVVFASPVLLVLTPYIAAKHALWSARERRAGMSRHAIVLMERLKGQLDPDTEGLLSEALKNDWIHHRKMTRRVTFAEARDLLTECGLHVHRYGSPDDPPHGEARFWTDPDGDLVARCEIDGVNPPTVRVLGTTFKGDDVRILLDVCLHRTDVDDSETA